MVLPRSAASRLKVLDERPPPPPSRVALVSLTTFCNAHCSFCCVLDILNKPELNPTDEIIFEKIREGRAQGCTILAFTGGEPTVHPRFAEFCSYGRSLGYASITINTNGIKFKSREWTREVLEAGLSHIDFSIHGHDAALHDAMVERPGAFAAIEKGCAHLRELGPAHGAVLGATTVVTATNAMHLPEIVDVLCDLGFQTLRFKHCFEGDRGADVSLVGRYSEMMPRVREAVARAYRRVGTAIQLTHFPLCLLDEEVVFATDLTDEDVLSFDRSGEVLIEGRASQHRRIDARPCERCVLSVTCAKLDHRYVAVQGDDELRPVETPEALTESFARGLSRYDVGDLRRRSIGERLEMLGAAAPAVTIDAPSMDQARRNHVTSVSMAAGCNLSCGTLCDCLNTPSPTDDDGVPHRVREGGGRLVLRGEAALDPAFDRALAAARQAGWAEVWLRTNGQLFASAPAAASLKERGVDGVIVPVFSHAPLVHDRVAGKSGAFVTAIRAMQALAAVGVQVSVETPLLAPRLQDIESMVRTLRRAVPSLASLRLYSPKRAQPPLLAPPRSGEARAGIERALAACESLGIAVRLDDLNPRSE
jgi:MoaA/NifB/PqqE/SkfB family radical SAM enzyme